MKRKRIREIFTVFLINMFSENDSNTAVHYYYYYYYRVYSYSLPFNFFYFSFFLHLCIVPFKLTLLCYVLKMKIEQQTVLCFYSTRFALIVL